MSRGLRRALGASRGFRRGAVLGTGRVRCGAAGRCPGAGIRLRRAGGLRVRRAGGCIAGGRSGRGGGVGCGRGRRRGVALVRLTAGAAATAAGVDRGGESGVALAGESGTGRARCRGVRAGRTIAATVGVSDACGAEAREGDGEGGADEGASESAADVVAAGGAGPVGPDATHCRSRGTESQSRLEPQRPKFDRRAELTGTGRPVGKL